MDHSYRAENDLDVICGHCQCKGVPVGTYTSIRECSISPEKISIESADIEPFFRSLLVEDLTTTITLAIILSQKFSSPHLKIDHSDMYVYISHILQQMDKCTEL